MQVYGYRCNLQIGLLQVHNVDDVFADKWAVRRDKIPTPKSEPTNQIEEGKDPLCFLFFLNNLSI